jgi:hypothetical protein
MAKSFGELVNDAIAESKVSLDPLTPANFLTPPRTVMYNNFKRWVNMAYKELFMRRTEWSFRTQRANVPIWPRIHLAGLTYTPAVGDVLSGQSTGQQFTIEAVHGFEEPADDGTVEYTLSVTPLTNYKIENLLVREKFNRVTPTFASNVGYLKGVGFYDFRDTVVGLDDIDINTVRIHEVIAESLADGRTVTTNFSPVIPVLYDKMFDTYQGATWTGERPQYITINPQGFYELYPQPDRKMYISFDYNTAVNAMVDYDDVPGSIPEKYEDYLLWRAVQEYADFDSNGKLFMRANKHTNDYIYWLERDDLPPVRVETGLFYRGRSQGYFGNG